MAPLRAGRWALLLALAHCAGLALSLAPCGPITAPSGPIAALLLEAGIDAPFTAAPLDSGFCNDVFEVRVAGRERPLVAKLFSSLAKARVPAAARGVVDVAAGAAGLGPRVLVRTDGALLSEFVSGRTATEADVLGDGASLALAVAPLLNSLHQLRPWPAELPKTNALYNSVDAMLDRIARNPGAPSPHAPSLVHLRTEATRLFAKLDDSCLGGDYVMGHGDLKPSNVMLQAEGEGPLFIDFELAGPNFRGYDVFKLFRARDRVPDESLKYFAEAYLGPGRAKSGSVDAVVAESLLFEPLEAVIFFKFAAVELPGQTDKWDALAASRWDGYVRSVADFDRNLATLERMRRSAATAR